MTTTAPPPTPAAASSAPAARAARPSSPTAALLRSALLALAAVAAWLVAFGVVISGAQETQAQHRLYATLRGQLAAEVGPVSAPIRTGSPVAVLTIPRLGLHNAVVVQGTTSRALESGPGHRPDTVLPGQAGVSVVYGRAVTFGAPFRHLQSLRTGDRVQVTTQQGAFTYVVQGRRQRGVPVAAPAPGTARLTLGSADGTSAGGPPQTAYVDAVLAKPGPAGRVAAASSADGAMQGDTSSLTTLVLWLELLLVAVLGLTWARRRWGRQQGWLVGVPVVLASAWGASESLWVLLPNLI